MAFFDGLGKRLPRALSGKHLDGEEFCDHMHDIGRAYRHRAIELIEICRLFSEASKQSFPQDTALTSVLEKCDVAIECAIKSRKKASQESDYHFEFATRVLIDYELNFHHRATVGYLMEEAREQDMKNMHKSRNRSNDHTLIDVEFHIMSSLPCEDPIIVKQKLSDSSGTSVLPEILWNFSHFEDEKRLRLAQNPHFYVGLPKSPAGYGDSFRTQPTEIYKGTIYVLTNNLVPKLGDSRRIFFEFGGKTRAFDNFWDTNNTLILKDVTGRLEGEALVEESIPVETKTAFWYRMVRMVPPPHQVKAPKHTRDWKIPIRELLGGTFPHTHVRISDLKDHEEEIRTLIISTG